MPWSYIPHIDRCSYTYYIHIIYILKDSYIIYDISYTVTAQLTAAQDIQQLFSVMDDGRKGYVSGSDIMTLQAVDAANLSEHDLQDFCWWKCSGMHTENVWKMFGKWLEYIFIYTEYRYIAYRYMEYYIYVEYIHNIHGIQPMEHDISVCLKTLQQATLIWW